MFINELFIRDVAQVRKFAAIHFFSACTMECLEMRSYLINLPTINATFTIEKHSS